MRATIGVPGAQPGFEAGRTPAGRARRTSALGRTTPGALPPPTADSPSTTAACQPPRAPAVAASASARARSCLDRRAQHPQHRHRLARRGRPSARPASLRARRRSACRPAAPASAGGVRSRSTRAARPMTMPACGPPSSLSPLTQTMSTPAATDSCTVGSQSSAGSTIARAEVLDHGDAGGVRRGDQRRQRRPLGEALDAEVRRDARAATARWPAVAALKSASRVRLVVPTSRSDAPDCAMHVGNAEAAADLDQLAARDEHLAAPGQRGQRQQHRGGVVVDDDRRLGAGDRVSRRSACTRARTALAGRQVVLERR